MKWEVTFYIAGKLIKEKYYAVNYSDAKVTGESRYPKAKIVSINPTFL